MFSELRHLMRVFWTATKSSYSMFFAQYTPAVFFGTAVPRYVFQSAFFVLLARFAGGEDLMRFALLGNAVQIAANMGLIQMSSVVESEKWIGTLPLLIAVPTHKLPPLLGRGMAAMTEATVGVLFALGAGVLLFRTTFPLLRVLLAFPLIMLIIVSILGMGLLLGAATLPTRYGTLISNLFAYIMMIVAGVNFPIDALPAWLQTIAHGIPMTNGLLAVRAVIDGASYADVLPQIGLEILVGLAYYVVGYWVFAWRLRAARQQGTLELF